MSTPTVVTSPARLWDQPLGLVRKYRLRATCSDAGGPVDVPVTVVTGVGPGPRVILIAGVHGDEVEGQFALQRLAETLEPAQLTGAVVMVLCANPLAALEGQRYTPEDGQDLNRVFPGNPQGSVSHRLAAALFEMVRAATFLMTLHSWYSTGSVLPYVEYPAAGDATAEASARAARACGLERIMPLDWHPGLLPAAAIRIGIPAIEAEIGGLGQSTPQGQELCERVILRFLRHAGVTQSAPEVRFQTRAVRGHHLSTPASGLLRLHIELGEGVRAGQRLAAVLNLAGQMLAEVVAPADGEIGAVRRFMPVRAGDHAVTVFEPIAAETLLNS